MTVNLAWRTAVATTFCTAADHAAGFAPLLAHRVISAIQRPYSPEPVRTADQRMFGTPGYNKMMALCRQIEEDCKTGALPHVVRSTKLDGTDYMVSAHDFAAWLALQGEEPSVHTRAWFKVQNVVGAESPAPGASAEKTPAEPAPDAWPWGGHHTESLGHLKAAALRFWVLYDPADATTAPTNSEVSKWLQDTRGVSQTRADAIASMLRPDDLPTGPRR